MRWYEAALRRVGVAVTSEQRGRGLEGSCRRLARVGSDWIVGGDRRRVWSISDWNSTAKMSDDEHEQTIAEDIVVTKYKMGGDIANRK